MAFEGANKAWPIRRVWSRVLRLGLQMFAVGSQHLPAQRASGMAAARAGASGD